jgi:N-acetylglucosaminyl-diphospho-decaprenol L-rhamnosyltransferase
MRVLVFSPDLLPLDGLPAVGSGLRAWGLGQGLRARGHDVVFSIPGFALDVMGARNQIPPEVESLAWRSFAMHEIVARLEPDLVLVSSWAIMDNLSQDPRRAVPVVLDQHGPHMFERHFQRVGNERSNRAQKLQAMAAADYFASAGERQHSYFQDWLREAGWTPQDRAERSFAIRFSVGPDLPKKTPSDELTFVYGGFWLPWQDPTNGLTALVEQLDRRGHGELHLFGGQHPWVKLRTGVFVQLVKRLERSRHVVHVGQLNHAELIRRYVCAHVAIDLMAHNSERELAFTSRTVEYLWCGLPVIYNHYSELSDLIRDYDAGWVVDPDNLGAIHLVLEEIFDHPDVVLQKGANAQRLVRDLLTWDTTIEPLDHVAESPSPRANARRIERVDPSLKGRVIWVYRHYGAREVVRRACGLGARALYVLLRQSFRPTRGRAQRLATVAEGQRCDRAATEARETRTVKLSIDVVIPTYGQYVLTERCLRSLECQTVAHSVIVFDNASSDDSVGRIRAAFPHVYVIASETNLGFAAACNRGVEAGTGDVVVLLNSDVDPRPAFLERIVTPFEDEAVGSVAALLLQVDESAIDTLGITADVTLAGFPRLQGRPLSEAGRPEPTLTGPSGGAAAYRRRAWEEVGGLDERIFMYSEDLDLALRLRAAGWQTRAAPDAVAVHLGSASIGGRRSRAKQQHLSFARGYLLRRYGVLRGRHALRTLASEAVVVGGYALLERDLSALRSRIAGWRAAARLPRHPAPPPEALDLRLGFAASLRLRRSIHRG